MRTSAVALAAFLSFAGCGTTALVDASSDGAGTDARSRGLGTAPSVDEWMVLPVAERVATRASLTSAERLALWSRLSLEQQTALTTTNAAFDALLAGDPGPRPTGSPFSVHEWITRGAGERARLRPTLGTSAVPLWNAMTQAQRDAMTVINRSWDALSAPVDLCATSGYPDIVVLDIPISFSRTILPYFGNETLIVSRFTVPTSYVPGPQSFLDATIAEWDGPPTFRTATLSERPCDFRPVDATGARGPMAISQGTLPGILHPIGAGPGQVVPGRAYYVSVKNWAQDLNDGAGGPSCAENTNCRASVLIVTRN